MKKLFIGLIFAALIIGSSLSIYAAPRRHHDGPPRHSQFTPEQEDARHIMQRTAMVLLEAQRAVIHGHRSMGLALAIATQSRARELYFNHQYRDAIFLSLRARNLAFRVIQNNRRRVKAEFFHDAMERRYHRQSPRDEVLDREHHRDQIGSDDDAAHITIELNL